MRIAVVSDIHANLTALEAVIADLRNVAPDLVVHGGDLCSGSKAAEVIDRIRELGWPGVYGNGDELLWDPDKAYRYLASVLGLSVRRVDVGDPAQSGVRAAARERPLRRLGSAARRRGPLRHERLLEPLHQRRLRLLRIRAAEPVARPRKRDESST